MMMGTSSSYKAPTTGGWPAAKRTATQFARQTGAAGAAGSVSARDVFDAYVRAHGGAGGAASSAVAAKSAATRLAGIFSSIGSDGLDRVLRDNGLEALIGGSPEQVIAAIVDLAVGPGSTIDESVARIAMAEVLGQEFGEAGSYAELQSDFAHLSALGTVFITLWKFLVEYIYRRLVTELGERLASGAIDAVTAKQRENDLRQYVEESVRYELRYVDTSNIVWNGPQASELIASLLEDAYRQL
jgi:hypothetical protein